jgi:hypothetical protein
MREVEMISPMVNDNQLIEVTRLWIIHMSFDKLLDRFSWWLTIWEMYQIITHNTLQRIRIAIAICKILKLSR